MGFKASAYVDIKVNEPDKAAEFYVDVLGWERLEPQGHERTLKFGDLTVFITKAGFDLKKSNVYFEMSTDEKIDEVKQRLLELGCSACDSGMDNAYMFTDPFGNNIHIYQE